MLLPTNMIITWLLCSLDHKHKGKGMWFLAAVSGEERCVTTLKTAVADYKNADIF